MSDKQNNKQNDIITLDITNTNILSDIFDKYFDEDKHVPVLYLVLDTNTLK